MSGVAPGDASALDADTLRAAVRGEAAALAQVSAALGGGAAPAALSALSAAETARLLLRLSPKRARALLRALDEAPSLALLHELDPAVTARLIDAEGAERLAKIVSKLDLDIAADFLAEAPAAVVEAALAQSPRAAELRAALGHRSGTAGAVMRRRLVAAPEDWTLGRLVAEIRARSEQIDRLHAAYVIDGGRRLTGYLKVRDLLLNPAETLVGDIRRPDVAAVTAETDRAEVAEIARREHLPALPVVDAQGRLVGMVTVEELREIDRAEADEDLALMAGLDPEASATDGPATILRRRLPWLASGLVGAGTAAVVVGAYEEALTEAAILASLIPIVMSLAGNAGIQASTVTVQAMTAGRLWTGDLVGRTLREIGGALLNGGVVGLIVALAILGLSHVVEIERAPALALTAALTLVIVTVQASAIGSLIPLALDRLRFDPAVATGVFITTSNDVVGVLIFFAIASALYI
jgi:magnesium transporter